MNLRVGTTKLLVSIIIIISVCGAQFEHVSATPTAQTTSGITVDPSTRTVENSKIKITWDLTNAEKVTGLYFKPYSANTNLTNSYGGEIFGNAIAWDPTTNSFLYGISFLNSTWSYTLENNKVQILINSISSDGYPISTRFEITSDSPVIKVDRTFGFSQKSIGDSLIETYRVRAYPRSSFTRYVWPKADGTLDNKEGINVCEAGCPIMDWAQSWIDLEAPNLNSGNGIGIGLVNNSNNPSSGIWLDRDLNSYTASISGLVQINSSYNQDLTVSYLIIPHTGDYNTLKSLIPTPTIYTQQQKEAFARLATSTKWLGIAITVSGAICFGVDPTCLPFFVISSRLGPVYSLVSLGYKALSADPPDPNFMVIAQPITPLLPLFDTSQGLTQQEAGSSNALLTNLEQAIGLQRAILTSIDRAQGAYDAGDTFWENQQVQAAQQYSAQLATLLNNEPNLLSNLQNIFQLAGIQQTFNANDVDGFKQTVASSGLPYNFVQVLTELGVDNLTLEQIKQDITSTDSSSVAALGDGSFPQILTDSSITTSLQEAGQALIQFASLKCPLTQGFWKNNPSVWPVTSLILGGQTYTQPELLEILNTASTGDASLILGHQLIATKLNIANGTNPIPVSTAIVNADNLLSGLAGKMPYDVKASSSLGQSMTNISGMLDSYNNAQLSPNCVP